jgi:hypothetical protein
MQVMYQVCAIDHSVNIYMNSYLCDEIEAVLKSTWLPLKYNIVYTCSYLDIEKLYSRILYRIVTSAMCDVLAYSNIADMVAQ